MSDKPQERRADYILLGEISADIKTVKSDMKVVKERVEKHGKDLAVLNFRSSAYGFVSGLVATTLLYLKMSIAKGGH